MLNDGRTLFMELPEHMTRRDRNGHLLLLPDAARRIDHARALVTPLPQHPSPGHLITIREALGFTPEAFGERLGVDEATVQRWEKNQATPDAATLETLRKLVKAATARGVILAA